MKDKTTIKSRIKTLKAILYTVMFFWLVILIYTIYDFINNDLDLALIIALMLLVSSMMVISRLKSEQQKKLKELDQEEED